MPKKPDSWVLVSYDGEHLIIESDVESPRDAIRLLGAALSHISRQYALEEVEPVQAAPATDSVPSVEEDRVMDTLICPRCGVNVPDHTDYFMFESGHPDPDWYVYKCPCGLVGIASEDEAEWFEPYLGEKQ